MIFETERLIVRKLILEDLDSFHAMQSNPKVMQYADGDVQSITAHSIELNELISNYTLEKNDFWIYAIERKSDSNFVGTIALVKDRKEDEIGCRFLERYWGCGYATEICGGFIQYCKSIGLQKIIGYVVDENSASVKILEQYNFKIVTQFMGKESQLPETKYELYL